MRDKSGQEIFENDRCKSWRLDELHPKGGFWLHEIVKFYNDDWYLFEEGHEYDSEDDLPVKLSICLMEIEVIK